MKDLIVVTGAAGFIGRNVVDLLNQRGCGNLILVDYLGTDEKWKNLRGLQFEDVLSPKRWMELVQGGQAPKARAIIHLGACSATTERDADYLLENNYRYTRTLAEWSMANGTRFVYASSAATYGDGSQGYHDDPAHTEKLVPLNMYGYSKHMFDLWALRRGLLDRMVGLKYFNVYGPYEDHKGDMRSLVHKAYHQIKQRGYIELFKSERPDYKDGEQKRDFVYVRDAANATVYFALDSKVGGLFNCGASQARTWIDLAKALFAAMELKPDIRFIDLPEILRGKYQYFTQAESANLRQAGYTAPFASIEDGVRDYVKNYLENIG
ncbi:MAG TPA: ADP-glyceromanno-heptose 6-epimerase [Candidatus Methylacidiphilales bacterium]